jgi:hypothetical protein
LDRQVLPHRLRDGIAVLARLDALLREELDLSSPVLLSAPSPPSFAPQTSDENKTHLFWNQIWTDRSVILISSAIFSRTVAVGVGFLLNSFSSVTSWSWVARWRFWFFCCWVRVLLRGGRRDAEVVLVAEVEAVGDGVEEALMAASSGDMADISTFTSTAMPSRDALSMYQCPSQPSRYFRELSSVARREPAVAIGVEVEESVSRRGARERPE